MIQVGSLLQLPDCCQAYEHILISPVLAHIVQAKFLLHRLGSCQAYDYVIISQGLPHILKPNLFEGPVWGPLSPPRMPTPWKYDQAHRRKTEEESLRRFAQERCHLVVLFGRTSSRLQGRYSHSPMNQ